MRQTLWGIANQKISWLSSKKKGRTSSRLRLRISVFSLSTSIMTHPSHWTWSSRKICGGNNECLLITSSLQRISAVSPRTSSLFFSRCGWKEFRPRQPRCTSRTPISGKKRWSWPTQQSTLKTRASKIPLKWKGGRRSRFAFRPNFPSVSSNRRRAGSTLIKGARSQRNSTWVEI